MSTPAEGENVEAKYSVAREIISILALAGGTVLLTVGVSLAFNFHFGLIVLGAILVILAILIGYNK